MKILLWLLVFVSVIFLLRNIQKSDSSGIIAQAIACYLTLTLIEYLESGYNNLSGLVILLVCSAVSVLIHKDIRKERTKNEPN